MVIRWNEPRFDSEDLKEVSKVIIDNYVNEGPKTKEFEKILSEYLNVKNVVMVTNGTVALYLALKSIAILKGKEDFEVIIPDMTMFATATAVELAGGKPVIVDVEEKRGVIDLEKIEEKITEKTLAIMPVQILGRGVDMEKLKQITEKYNLMIVEDSAGALGSMQGNEYLGTIGDVGCFSLQSNKIITTGQGGVIVSDNDLLIENIRRLRDFGRADKSEFLHNEIGYNFKFSDLAASLGVSQFKKIEERKKMLVEQYETYFNELSSLEEIKFFGLKEKEVPLWIDVYVKKRDKLFSFLKEREVFSRPCWPAIHQNPPFLQNDENFPVSSKMASEVLWLPNGPGINKDQIIYICDLIKEFYNGIKENS